MPEFKINIAPDKEALVKMLVVELGGEIIDQTETNSYKQKRTNKSSEIKILKTKEKPISPTFLFGKWKSLDIDAKKLRTDAWDRSEKY